MDPKIISEIYMLYELSMAIGNSLDFEENCHDFLNTLMAKKELDRCWIFENSRTGLQLTNSIPKESSIPKIKLGAFERACSINFEENTILFESLKLKEGGALAVFPLPDYGDLIIYSKKREEFSNKEINQLTPLVKKFAISLEASSVHKSSVIQKNELDRLYGELSETNNQLLTEILIRKDSEESLIVEKQRVEESLKFKERFLANMSHEIRTPMNGILGMSKLLESAELEGRHKVHLDSIQSSAQNLLVIINDILDLSKIEAGKLELEEIGFNLEDVLKATVSGAEYLASEKDLFIDLRIAHNLIDEVIIGDPVRLGQILTNLLSNAIKFTAKGKVTLSSRVIDSNYLELSVSDTGIGISKEKIKTIFDSFSQADSSTTRKFGGTGLGLSISKQLVELHGGKLQVRSTEGLGTTFYFSFPLKRGSAEDLPKTKDANLGNLDMKGVKVMLVEDNKINQVYAMSILEEARMEVTLAENGIEALNILRLDNDFDIILMDMQMPEMGGEEATKILRKELKLETPVIALTANALRGDMEKYLNLGMNGYISKPFDDVELVHEVAKITSKYQAQKSKQKSMKTTNNDRLFSLDKLEKMSRGKQEFIDKMIKLFIDESSADLNHLLAAFQEKDYQRLGEMAHKMKSSLGMLSVNSISDPIRNLEEYSLDQINLDRIPSLVDNIKTTCATLLHQLKTL